MQGRFRHILILIILLAGAPLAIAQSSVPDVVCVGTTRVYGVKGTPGAIYAWKVDGVLQNTSADSIKVVWNKKGPHTVEVQEYLKGCYGDIQTEQVNVTDQLTAAVSITADKNNICPGTMVSFTATATNGGPAPHYQWKVNGIKAGTNAAVYSYAPADGDKVTVEMTPKAECVSGNTVSSNSITMKMSEIIIALQKIVIDPVSQKGSIDITVSGGSGPGNYLYSWSNGATTEDIANLAEGTYDVTVTDKLTNCNARGSFVVEINQLAVSCTVTQPTCDQTGSIKVVTPVPSGGLVYELRGITPAAGLVTNITGIFDNLVPGASYGIKVKNTITGKVSPEVIQQINAIPSPPPVPKLSVPVTPTCNNADGTVMVDSPRGTDFQYSIDGGAFKGSAVFTNQKGTTHTVRVRNVKTGCISENTILVPTTSPVITAKGDPAICHGGTGFIEVSIKNVKAGTYTIHHDKGQFEVAIQADGTGKIPVPVGKYKNLTMEVNGCSSYDPSKPVNVEVTQPEEIVITEIVTPINPAANEKASITLKVTGGNNNYSYSWANGETGDVLTNLDAGLYHVTVSDENGCSQEKTIEVSLPTIPHAFDDSYEALCNIVAGNVLLNDSDKEIDQLFIGKNPVMYPKHGTVEINPDGSGTFEYHTDLFFTGLDSFKYELFNKNRYPGIYGTVVIKILPNKDRDQVPDSIDKDMDGDGILNDLDGLEDTDKDGLPNYMDIDSDGDGIPDQIEAQAGHYIPPLYRDENKNGVDDAYDNFQMTRELTPVDTDGDGTPDYLDSDSDNDGIPDRIEGHDANLDGRPDHVPLGKDADMDGLDDGYDSYMMECDPQNNIIRTYAAMQDSDDDGLPNWRDDNDDNDEFLTKYEDMDGDGDYSNDDFDYDGYPEYLDHGRECDLFIPNAFSPNPEVDNVHNLFMIYCINHYPNAKMYIFDQMGNKLYEKENYGNLERWPTPEQAWWDGKPDRGRGRGERVAPGTYYYVLDLGNGEVKKSFVFVSY